MKAERLLAHYERIADGPDAIARLRRFVLDLAVRGKLVPQDSGDEPASALLGRKKAGKYSGGPFVLPKAWAWVGVEAAACSTPCWPRRWRRPKPLSRRPSNRAMALASLPRPKAPAPEWVAYWHVRPNGFRRIAHVNVRPEGTRGGQRTEAGRRRVRFGHRIGRNLDQGEPIVDDPREAERCHGRERECRAPWRGVRDWAVAPRGFRASFRMWAGETRPRGTEVAEMALAHTIKDKAEVACAHCGLPGKRRPLMDARAEHCGRVPADVITLTSRRRRKRA